MSYTPFIDYISLTSEVRELARSVVNTSVDFTDVEIIRYQYMRYSKIRTMTDKDDWDPTDREFGSLQRIETELAASDIIEHYGTANDIVIWQAMRESALSDLTAIVANMDTGTIGDESGSIQETSYKSWNLNPDVDPPNRLAATTITEVDF
jgi:hypothetical protein